MKKPSDYAQFTFRVSEEMKTWVQKTSARHGIAPSHFIRTLVFNAMRIRDDSVMRRMIGTYIGNPSWTRIQQSIETPEKKTARDKQGSTTSSESQGERPGETGARKKRSRFL